MFGGLGGAFCVLGSKKVVKKEMNPFSFGTPFGGLGRQNWSKMPSENQCFFGRLSGAVWKGPLEANWRLGRLKVAKMYHF